MTFSMRDRPDGQVEILLCRPEVVGVMADRAMARKFLAFLHAEVLDQAFVQAKTNETEAEIADLPDHAAAAPRRVPAVLPALIDERPRPPVFVASTRRLSEAETEAAFDRLLAGEKLTEVASSFALTMGQLRGMWAAHRKKMQRHLAEGGQQPCSLCQRPFTPSISSPDKCARCAHA